jgi:hypothetical protein
MRSIPQTPTASKPAPNHFVQAGQQAREVPPDRLLVNEDQIRAFVQAIFCYAAEESVISLRIFDENSATQWALSKIPIRLNGGGLDELIEAAIAQAQFAAEHPQRTVFCPPLVGLSNRKTAKEKDVREAYALSVECDQAPEDARQRLEILLGPATVIVASGGLWTDPETGEIQPKVHLHWRLKEPATGDDLPRLKHTRRLATTFVGGDPTNISLVHPIRWPGS